MTEALQRYNEETNKTTTKADILEYLAFSTYMEGGISILKIVPSHPVPFLKTCSALFLKKDQWLRLGTFQILFLLFM